MSRSCFAVNNTCVLNSSQSMVSPALVSMTANRWRSLASTCAFKLGVMIDSLIACSASEVSSSVSSLMEPSLSPLACFSSLRSSIALTTSSSACFSSESRCRKLVTNSSIESSSFPFTSAASNTTRNAVKVSTFVGSSGFQFGPRENPRSNCSRWRRRTGEGGVDSSFSGSSVSTGAGETSTSITSFSSSGSSSTSDAIAPNALPICATTSQKLTSGANGKD